MVLHYTTATLCSRGLETGHLKYQNVVDFGSRFCTWNNLSFSPLTVQLTFFSPVQQSV